ncbi:MAG: acyl-CoA desaturase [Henriciella sp.]
MCLGWIFGGTIYFSWASVVCFLLLSAATLCLGHSLGMHRKLIHESYQCPKWLERFFVWLGTLVGLGGPFTMMRTHDLRDGAQRQSECHPFFSHQNSFQKDAYWQLHCKLHLKNCPKFNFPNTLRNDSFFRFVEITSMGQQLIIGAPLFLIGGWGFVFWGICGRVTVSILGHWLVGYFAHNTGQRDWHVDGAAVQGHNIAWAGLISFGESWHNNHHAFPGSARIGFGKTQADPGYWVLKSLERVGLVKNLILPDDLPTRAELSETVT